MLSKKAQDLSFVERVFGLLDRVSYRCARTQREYAAIFELRYHALFRDGSIGWQASGRWRDDFDAAANVVQVGIFLDSRLAAAARLHLLWGEQTSSPTAAAFTAHFARQLRLGGLIINPDHLVAEACVVHEHPELPYLTIRSILMAAEHYKARAVLWPALSHQRRFYCKALGAELACPARLTGLHGKPVELLVLDCSRQRERTLDRHPYWVSSEQERQSVFALCAGDVSGQALVEPSRNS